MDPLRNRVLPIVGGAAIVAVVAVAVADRDDATTREAEGLCSWLACTEAQAATVRSHVASYCAAGEARARSFREAMLPLRPELARAPVADSTLTAAIDASRAHADADIAASYAALTQIHNELDARQRELLAEAVATRGAVAVLGCQGGAMR